MLTENQTSLDVEEVPCPDAVPHTCHRITERLCGCVIQHLHRQCAKILAGSWSSAENVVIEKLRHCGLSNYLFLGSLKDDVPVVPDEPRRVLLRVYGEVLRSNTDSIVMDAISFALLAEKRIGPGLHGIFRGGRIEEYVQSRPLTCTELPLPSVFTTVARHLARIHSLNMPFCKQPTFIFKMIERHLSQLTGVNSPPRRPTPDLDTASTLAAQAQQDADTTDGADDCLDGWTEVSFTEAQEMTSSLLLVEEFGWIKSQIKRIPENLLPVVFCHNDFQENNLLLLNNPEEDGTYDLLPIDFEYAGYNYRGFDVGNHFNEWCFDYTNPDPPYFFYQYEAYPSEEDQKEFWKAYLRAWKMDRRKSADASNLANGDILSLITPIEDGDEELSVNFDHLWLETWLGSLTSHMVWAAWSLIQTQLSSIRFRFDEYAAARMDAYFKLKSSGLAKFSSLI
ncbi:choline/ethanolamine kinase [Clonorchis sinensis]|nr:choline/ethanolamine kinase [Clonorchis sinensis]